MRISAAGEHDQRPYHVATNAVTTLPPCKSGGQQYRFCAQLQLSVSSFLAHWASRSQVTSAILYNLPPLTPSGAADRPVAGAEVAPCKMVAGKRPQMPMYRMMLESSPAKRRLRCTTHSRCSSLLFSSENWQKAQSATQQQEEELRPYSSTAHIDSLHCIISHWRMSGDRCHAGFCRQM